MKIELARPEHYDAVCEVIAESDALHVTQLPDVFCHKRDPARPRDLFEQRVKGPGSAIFVAVIDTDVIGVVEVMIKPELVRDGFVPRKVALIDTVSVRAGHRGRGVGTQLIARAETWANEQGATAIELNVWSTNTSAKKLYDSLGYVTRSVRMERSLKPV